MLDGKQSFVLHRCYKAKEEICEALQQIENFYDSSRYFKTSGGSLP